jgi:hypothetical protein
MDTDERLPDARPQQFNALTSSSVLTSELLMTSVAPKEGLLINNIRGIFSGRIPLKTLAFESWPEKSPELQCLHCGGPCDVGPPVPAVKQYENQIDSYWVYGPFCRPCCAFGSICENDGTSKQLAATTEMLRRYFGVKIPKIAPPRASHYRFGGPLSDSDFYGESGYTALNTIQPPFVTFANYVVGVHGSKEPARALLPQSAGRLINLERPAERDFNIVEKKSTGKPPLFLELLASLTSVNDVTDVGESISVKEPKKRKAETKQTESTNFLKQYVKK